MKVPLSVSCFVVGCILFLSGSVYAGLEDFLKDSARFELFVNDRFHTFNNYYDIGTKKFSQHRDLHFLYVNPTLDVSLGRSVRGVLEVETEFMFDFHDHTSEEDFDVRNAYLLAMLPGCNWIYLLAGRQSIRTVDGLLYDDESPVLRLYADFERGFSLPFKLNTLITEVDNDSPYIHTELQYNISFFETVSLLYGCFRDTNDGIARYYNNLENTAGLHSRGTIHWAGISLRAFAGDFFLRINALYQRGSVNLRRRSAPIFFKPGTRSTDSVRMRGYLLDINCDYSLHKQASLSLFLYVSSGDRNPAEGTHRSFTSIYPYIDKTNIFFNGGIDGEYSSDTSGLNGIQPAGVVAPGLSFNFWFGERASLTWVGAYLLTHTGTGKNGHVYGWETDVMFFYNFSDRLQLFAEANFFVPGDYFKTITRHKHHSATEVIVGFNYLYSNN